MNKAQAAALLLMGAGLGVGGKEAATALSGKAEAAVRVPFVHAADLRRNVASGDLSVLVYATETALDGGVAKDIGQAKSCAVKAATRNALQLNMQALAKECVW